MGKRSDKSRESERKRGKKKIGEKGGRRWARRLPVENPSAIYLVLSGQAISLLLATIRLRRISADGKEGRKKRADARSSVTRLCLRHHLYWQLYIDVLLFHNCFLFSLSFFLLHRPATEQKTDGLFVAQQPVVSISHRRTID